MAFAWIIDGGLLPYIKGNGGVSASYILPDTQSLGSSQSLAGATVWMILRSSERNVPFAKIHVTRVEQFEDGLNKGDYLLSVDLVASYRITKDTRSTSLRVDQYVAALPIGVSKIEDSTNVAIEHYILERISVNFREPPDSVLNRVPAVVLDGPVKLVARRLIAAATSYLCLEEIWASKSFPALPPFANFAFFKSAKSNYKASEGLYSQLAVLDPTARMNGVAGPTTSTIRVPNVDTDLVPVDTTKLYARRFVARESPFEDRHLALEKTQHAEKIHQDILRDLAIYLQSIGFIPLQSFSIDLCVETPKGLCVFEIKSATSSNLLAQAAKGTFQLLCYRNALLEAGQKLKSNILICQHTEVEDLNLYVAEVLESAGIGVLYYDEKKNWPARIGNLEKELV